MTCALHILRGDYYYCYFFHQNLWWRQQVSWVSFARACFCLVFSTFLLWCAMQSWSDCSSIMQGTNFRVSCSVLRTRGLASLLPSVSFCCCSQFVFLICSLFVSVLYICLCFLRLSLSCDFNNIFENTFVIWLSFRFETTWSARLSK